MTGGDYAILICACASKGKAKMKLFAFLAEYGDLSTIVSKLRRDGLLRNQLICRTCGHVMTERKVGKSDGIMFECSKRTCRHTKSVRVDSFFHGSKLSLTECMIMLHLWCKGYTEKLILEDYSFSIGTVVDWFRYSRELCVDYFERNTCIIGGPGTVVEIDETMVVKRKYDRGRMLAAGWLFGGIERREDGEFRCFVCLVYDRSATHLTHLIRQHVALGTHIMTDGWGAYSGLSTMGYQHSVVVHNENFVSPENRDIHTQQIEATWCSLKRFIRARGTNKGEFFIEYICEWIFRRTFRDVFNALLNVIRTKYEFL